MSIPSAVPHPSAEAEPWGVALCRDIVRWVEAKLRGPFALTSYTSALRPSASSFRRSLIYDSANNIPMCSDASGNWNWVAAYSTGTATASSNAGTINQYAGKITTEALTTAAAAAQVITVTNSLIAATDLVFASVALGTSTTGRPVIGDIKPAAGSVAINLLNTHASAAFNGTFVISFLVLKA